MLTVLSYPLLLSFAAVADFVLLLQVNITNMYLVYFVYVMTTQNSGTLCIPYGYFIPFSLIQ